MPKMTKEKLYILEYDNSHINTGRAPSSLRQENKYEGKSEVVNTHKVADKMTLLRFKLDR